MADLYLQPKPGADVVLAMAVAAALTTLLAEEYDRAADESVTEWPAPSSSLHTDRLVVDTDWIATAA